MTPRTSRPLFLERGFSMIEVMIAILVLSLGVLGVLGLIIKSLQFSSSSNYRTLAAQQAHAMAEVLRANPSMLASFSGLPVGGATPVTSCMQTAGCTSAQWTTTAFGHWKSQLAGMLPRGDGFVCRDSVADNLAVNAVAPAAANSWLCDGTGPFVVKVCWNESRAAIGAFAGGAMCSWTTL